MQLLTDGPGFGELYATGVYPHVSSFLSRIASLFPFSLQIVVIALIVLSFIAIIVVGCRKKRGVLRVVLSEAVLIAFAFIWTYSGWCLNYARSPLVVRAGVASIQYDSLVFRNFLNVFTEETNQAYVKVGDVERDDVENAVKEFFKTVPSRYGLCQPKDWQHIKPMPISGIMSSMGVLGYLGPFFDEAHLNRDLLPQDYPFNCAHEFSHLFGVSSEAEANWWAFHCCRASSDHEIRYSAYLNILPHVLSNAAIFLSEQEFRLLVESIRPEVLEDYKSHCEYWSAKRVKLLDDAQRWVYNLFLRSNGIPSGIRNYSEVVGLLTGVDYLPK